MAEEFLQDKVIDVDAEDAYNGHPKNFLLSFPVYIMLLLKKVNDTTFCEWHGGYNKQNTIALDNNRLLVNESHVDNTRAIFCNGVLTLYDTLSPRFTKEERTEIDKILEKIEKIDSYEQNECIKPHRELLRLINLHLARRNYYNGDDYYEDGKPVDPLIHAQLDENGQLVLGRNV